MIVAGFLMLGLAWAWALVGAVQVRDPREILGVLALTVVGFAFVFWGWAA